jgi:hypothetical protein
MDKGREHWVDLFFGIKKRICASEKLGMTLFQKKWYIYLAGSLEER